nr:atherin-like [Aegilops tauschii subsp. strangulata]
MAESASKTLKKIPAATGRVRSPPDGSRRRPQPLRACHVASAPPAARAGPYAAPRPARATPPRASPPPSCAGTAVPRRRRLAAVLHQPCRSPPSAGAAASVPRRRLPDRRCPSPGFLSVPSGRTPPPPPVATPAAGSNSGESHDEP